MGRSRAPQVATRDAVIEDAGRVATLLAELGYADEPTRVRARVERLLADPDSAVLVAAVEHHVIGLAALHVIPLLERERPTCRLTALVVAARARRIGIGRVLVERAAARARAAGCDRLEVTSSTTREDAAAFYRGVGFADAPHRFLLPLVDRAGGQEERSAASLP